MYDNFENQTAMNNSESNWLHKNSNNKFKNFYIVLQDIREMIREMFVEFMKENSNHVHLKMPVDPPKMPADPPKMTADLPKMPAKVEMMPL